MKKWIVILFSMSCGFLFPVSAAAHLASSENEAAESASLSYEVLVLLENCWQRIINVTDYARGCVARKEAMDDDWICSTLNSIFHESLGVAKKLPEASIEREWIMSFLADFSHVQRIFMIPGMEVRALNYWENKLRLRVLAIRWHYCKMKFKWA